MTDRSAQTCVNAFLALNSCAWPYVFGGIALWRGDLDGLWIQVSIGVLVGAGIFLVAAGLRLLLPSRPAGSCADSGQLRHVPSAGKFAGAAGIMLLLGTACLVAEILAPKPPIHRFGERWLESEKLRTR